MAEKNAANKAVGVSKGGRNTKIHAIVDGLGNPVAFLLSGGNDHDSKHAIPLLSQIEIKAATSLATRLMAQKQSEIISLVNKHAIRYLRRTTPLNRGQWIPTPTRNAIWSSVSFRRSNGFAGSLLAMTNWTTRFWHSY